MLNFQYRMQKNLAERKAMIEQDNTNQQTLEGFILPFGGKLDRRNRWVKLAETLPWSAFCEVYNKSLSSHKGRPALSGRIVIGALIIKHKLNLPDEEAMEQIKENPYLQYFMGYKGYSYDNGFEPSLFVEIRKRLGKISLSTINDIFIKHTQRSRVKRRDKRGKSEGSSGGSSEGEAAKDEHKSKNSGTLLLDATVAPADIKHPTDFELLNISREKSERLIDILYKQSTLQIKPRTYRRKARKKYLSLAKQRRKSRKRIRRGIKEQLNYVRRNLKTIHRLLDENGSLPFPLSHKDQRIFWIIQEVYRQQKEMYTTNSHSIPYRIVSISQPHVRPIVRGKSNAPVEFGAKLSASVVDENIYLDRIGWDAFNESLDLPTQVENYRIRFGFYPEVVTADKIYGSRYNRNFLKKLGIRYSGASLGRPVQNLSKSEKDLRKKEANSRNAIEGKFGVGKRKFGLDRILAKLKNTSESWIAAIVLVMNITHWLSKNFLSFFKILMKQLFSNTFCKKFEFSL